MFDFKTVSGSAGIGVYRYVVRDGDGLAVGSVKPVRKVFWACKVVTPKRRKAVSP